MIKLDDKVFVGVLAGIGGNLVKNIFNGICYLLGVKNYLTWQIAASAYLPKNKVQKPPALIIGAFTDYSVAAILGVWLVYLFYFTDTDHFITKGLTTSAIAWLLIFGVAGTQLGKITPNTVDGNLCFLASHLLLGLTAAWLITRYGQQALTTTKKED